MIELPTPAGYRKSVPVHAAPLPLTAHARRSERRRWIIGFAVAAAFHAVIIGAWWLTPPLKLKTTPAPERWVQVLSIPMNQPKKSAPPTAAPPTSAAPVTSAPAPAPHKSRGHKRPRPTEPSAKVPPDLL